MWRDPLLILIQLAQKNRIEQKIERLLLFQGPIQQKLAKTGHAFTISSLLIKHRLVFQLTLVKFMDHDSELIWFGKTFLERFIEKYQSELLLNLRIFYLSHAVCKILQFLMMKRDVKLDLTVIAKESSSKTRITSVYNSIRAETFSPKVHKLILSRKMSSQNLNICSLIPRWEGPHNCIMFSQTEKVPPKFVSDSDKITIATYTGNLEHEANSRGYMFKFKRISETEANQMKREMTMQE